MNTSTSFIVIVLLLAANGFYVAAEFALVKAKTFRIEAMADNGSGAARLTLRMQNNLEAYLAACQLGITMASLGLGWVGEPAVAALLEPALQNWGMSDSSIHTTAFILGFLIFSSLHIVVGEQVPKTFAIRKSEPVSVWVAYPLQFTYLLVWPLNWLLNNASKLILSAFGVEAATHGDVLSGDEIKGLVATSKEYGELKGDHADMLQNLFEFDQRTVGRVMLPRSSVHTLALGDDASDNLETIRTTEHSRFPLIDSDDDDSLLGIVLVKDVYRALLDGQKEPWLNLKHYCRKAVVVPESQRISELFDLMREKHAHMAFVVDEYGEFIGVVTLEDLLEEIVGDIQDETDDEDDHPQITEIKPNQWQADGLISLSDLERFIGATVPADLDANTLSGVFLQRLARMPKPGDEVHEGEFIMRVETIEDHRVADVTIRRIEPQDGDHSEAASAKVANNDTD